MTDQTLKSLGRVLGVIPARLESLRLPRKVLRPIGGRPMIAWVYERGIQAASLDRLLVATDSEEVLNFCTQNDIPVLMTSREHRSGTDRLVEVSARELSDIYVNIQGDEPMINAEHLELLLRPFRDSPGTQVSTLKVAIGIEAARNPNNVKVVTDENARALYFSRAQIPFSRASGSNVRYYKHLGIYAYTRGALRKFGELPPSDLERVEQLEQLRFLENGIPVTVVETLQDTIGVDTEDDLRRVEEFFRKGGFSEPGV